MKKVYHAYFLVVKTIQKKLGFDREKLVKANIPYILQYS